MLNRQPAGDLIGQRRTASPSDSFSRLPRAPSSHASQLGTARRWRSICHNHPVWRWRERRAGRPVVGCAVTDAAVHLEHGRPTGTIIGAAETT